MSKTVRVKTRYNPREKNIPLATRKIELETLRTESLVSINRPRRRKRRAMWNRSYDTGLLCTLSDRNVLDLAEFSYFNFHRSTTEHVRLYLPASDCNTVVSKLNGWGTLGPVWSLLNPAPGGKTDRRFGTFALMGRLRAGLAGDLSGRQRRYVSRAFHKLAPVRGARKRGLVKCSTPRRTRFAADKRSAFVSPATGLLFFYSFSRLGNGREGGRGPI